VGERPLQEIEVELRVYVGERGDAVLKVLDGTWVPMADVVRDRDVEVEVRDAD
jgi:hypothetical protein